MKKQFVTYEIAKQLKELGFDEECFGYYHVNEGYIKGYAFCYSENTRTSDCSVLAPLWQQVIDWLREKHDLHIENGWCISDPFGDSKYGYGVSVYNKIKDEFIVRDFNLDYYKAREQAILKAIELCQNKK